MVRQGETHWRNLPAKRLLLSYESSHIQKFAVRIKESEWLVISNPLIITHEFELQEEYKQKIINSIQIRD